MKPIEHDSTPVQNRGDPLGAIWWRGRQWAVTSDGIEALDGCYYIAANRLLEDCPIYGWPPHMADKNWVDVPDFITAWLVAIALHGKDARMIATVLDKATQRRDVVKTDDGLGEFDDWDAGDDDDIIPPRGAATTP